MFGRKLDMVCSTQPYGNVVRYSSAPKSDPAIDGDTRMPSSSRAGLHLRRETSGRRPRLLPAASAPPRACASFTPGNVHRQFQFQRVRSLRR